MMADLMVITCYNMISMDNDHLWRKTVFWFVATILCQEFDDPCVVPTILYLVMLMPNVGSRILSKSTTDLSDPEGITSTA